MLQISPDTTVSYLVQLRFVPDGCERFLMGVLAGIDGNSGAGKFDPDDLFKQTLVSKLRLLQPGLTMPGL